MTKRYYSWALVIYDYVDNQMELELLLLSLLKQNIISNYIFILHDKDEAEPHIHLGLTFKQNVSLAKIKQVLELGQNIFGVKLGDRKSYYDYLLHNEEEAKNIYDPNLIHSNNYVYFCDNKIVYDKETERIQNMIEDYLNNETYLFMALKYGRDWILNYDRYRDYFDLIRSQEREDKTILSK